MADINSNKKCYNYTTNYIADKSAFSVFDQSESDNSEHYSESRAGLNGRCSFSPVCAASEYILGLFHPPQRL